MCKSCLNQLPLAHPQLGAWPATQASSLAGHGIRDLPVHRPALSPLSHSSWCIYVFLMNSSLQDYEVTFSVSFMAFVWKSILCDISIATLAFFPCPSGNIFSNPLLSVCVGVLFFFLRWVSCGQHMCGSSHSFSVSSASEIFV